MSSRREPGSWGAHPKEDDIQVVEGGQILSFPENDETINLAIARFQDQLGEWNHRSFALSRLVRDVRGWADGLWERFIAPEWGGKCSRRPPILFRLQWEGHRVLGHYRRGRNDFGFRWEINLNPRHIPERSQVQLASVVLHELLHAGEDLAGVALRSPNGYHSAGFRRIAAKLGIPCTPYGREMALANPSPFLDWARARGLTDGPAASMVAPSVIAVSALRAPPKRFAWICRCDVTAYVARGSDLRARCELCGSLFRCKGHSQ